MNSRVKKGSDNTVARVGESWVALQCRDQCRCRDLPTTMGVDDNSLFKIVMTETLCCWDSELSTMSWLPERAIHYSWPLFFPPPFLHARWWQEKSQDPAELSRSPGESRAGHARSRPL